MARSIPQNTNKVPAEHRKTVVDEVVEAVQRGIRSGRYVPGQRLVETDLTRELGVSRGPLREGLARLAATGVLEIEPFRGAVVRRMTRQDALELFEVRAVLEGEAARLAASRIDEGNNRKRVQAAAKAMAAFRRKDDLPAYMEVNAEFHDLLVELAGNRLLQTLVQQLQTHSYRMQFINLLGMGTKDVSLDDHDHILKAVLAGDARKAELAMRRHIQHSRDWAMTQAAEHFA